MSRTAGLGLILGAGLALAACVTNGGLGFSSSSLAMYGAARTAPIIEVELQVDTVVSGLETPWDLTWGPDGVIWITERRGAISRLDPLSGKLTRVGTVRALERGESGLLGLALHPEWPQHPYVYVMYSFALGQGDIGNRLVRMRYENGALGPEEILLDSLPGAPNHDGSRVAVGPDGLLYVTTGDATGAPQDTTSLGGKILRLTPDGKHAPGNPFGNYVYSYGHRNPQGLVFHPGTGRLYSSEHGGGSDDEVNLVLSGRNYGYGTVEGLCDSPAEQSFCRARKVVEPLATWTPTVGLAGMDVYHADHIRGWKGSLLVTSLKGRALYRLMLSPEGDRVLAKDSLLVGRYGRLRDVLVGPKGEVYVATSNKDGRGQPSPKDDVILRLTPY